MKILNNFILLLFFVPSLIWAQNPNWSINSAAFQYNMTVVSVTLTNCEIDNNPNNQIGAFINGNLAGYSKINTTVDGNNYAYLFIHSNSSSGDIITFKIYDADNDIVKDANQTIIFEENGSIGNTANPYEFASEYKLESLDIEDIKLYDYSSFDDSIAHLLLTNEIGDSTDATYTFIFDNLGSENTSFEFANNQLILQEAVDYPEQSSFNIHVMATTANGCKLSKNFTLEVLNTNVPPLDIIPFTGCFYENKEVGSYVILLTAIDSTPIDVHTYEFVNDSNFLDNGFFEINYDELLSKKVFDYETKTSYILQIKVIDAIGNFYIDTFSVDICDLTEYDNPLANNYISPNGDGFNDVFQVPNVSMYSNFSFHLYNDNGNEVYFLDENYNNDFNGTNNKNGQELPSGTYIYHFVNKDDASLKFEGKLIIKREKKF